MKVRRRLFLTTLVLGGGIWAFQPILRSRIEHRLSETLGVRVDVGSSKVSLIDATISLSDVVIHPLKTQPTDSNNSAVMQTKIAYAALRFDWSSAAYRNLRIENLLATGVNWAVNTPTIEDVPMAASKNPVDDMKLLLAEASADNSLARFEELIQPLKRRIADASSKQSQTHMEISSRLKSIGERLQEVFPSDSSPNPLRQRSVVDEVKKELAMIRQSVAEDRIHRKDADKTLASMKLSSKQGVLECVGETDPTSEAKVQLAALSLAKAAIAHDWNENRTIVHAVLQSMAVLHSNDVVADPAVPPRFNRERTHPIESLPSRFTHIDSARLRGTARFEGTSTPDARQGFDMRMKNISSKNESNESKPMVTLAITPVSENGSGHPILCAAERVAIPQSELSQIQMRLERTLSSQAKSTSHIQQASHGWSSTVSLPLAECIRSHCSDMSELTSALTSVPDSSKIRARLVGTTQTYAGRHTELSIEVEPESLKSLETAISSLGQKQLARRRHLLEARGNELVDNELLNIESRWEQLGDEHARTHSSWEVELNSLNEQVQRVESIHKRLSRQNSSLQR